MTSATRTQPTTSRPSGATGDDGIRSLPRRRSLPNGRAALGGLLVAAAVVVLVSIGEAGGRGATERYVVARRSLAIGTRLQAADLSTASLHLPAGRLRDRAFDRAATLLGAVVIAPVEQGELVQASAVIAATARDDQRQISVPIEAAHALGDTLRAGELVDVVATFGTGTEAFTATVVSGATIVGRSASTGPLGDGNDEVVLLAIGTAEEAMAVAHAVAAGQISLVRVNRVGATSPAAPYRAPRPAPSR